MNEDSLKLTAYFAERDRSGGQFLGDALLGICERHGLATSILLRGAEGFGRHQVLQTDRGADVLAVADASVQDMVPALVAAMQRHGVAHPSIRIRSVETLGRNQASGKLKRFVPLSS